MVEGDLVRAYQWAALAAQKAHPGAKELRENIKLNLSEAELQTAKRLVDEFIPRRF